jgi:hypothetical protein
MHLILYSKIGCHLCEGLQEKLQQITDLQINLEIRDITTNPDWFDRYQYEIPVLCLQTENSEQQIPRFSPRTNTAQIQKILEQYVAKTSTPSPPSAHPYPHAPNN